MYVTTAHSATLLRSIPDVMNRFVIIPLHHVLGISDLPPSLNPDIDVRAEVRRFVTRLVVATVDTSIGTKIIVLICEVFLFYGENISYVA